MKGWKRKQRKPVQVGFLRHLIWYEWTHIGALSSNPDSFNQINTILWASHIFLSLPILNVCWIRYQQEQHEGSHCPENMMSREHDGKTWIILHTVRVTITLLYVTIRERSGNISDSVMPTLCIFHCYIQSKCFIDMKPCIIKQKITTRTVKCVFLLRRIHWETAVSLRDVRLAQMRPPPGSWRAPLLSQQQRPENEESHETAEFDWSKSGDSEALSDSKIKENPEQQHKRKKAPFSWRTKSWLHVQRTDGHIPQTMSNWWRKYKNLHITANVNAAVTQLELVFSFCLRTQSVLSTVHVYCYCNRTEQ